MKANAWYKMHLSPKFEPFGGRGLSRAWCSSESCSWSSRAWVLSSVGMRAKDHQHDHGYTGTVHHSELNMARCQNKSWWIWCLNYIYKFDIRILQTSSLIQQGDVHTEVREREKERKHRTMINLFGSSWAVQTHMSLHIHAGKPCAHAPKFDFKHMSLRIHSGNLDLWKVDLLVFLTTKESKCLWQPPDPPPPPKPWYILAQSFGACPFVLKKRHISFQVETCSNQMRVTKELQVLLVSTWLTYYLYRTICHMCIKIHVT